jgi:hypothetical protein
VRAAAQGLRHISVRCVNLGIKRSNITGGFNSEVQLL